jgi:cytochrome bd-type quinol oxidase subunit 2
MAPALQSILKIIGGILAAAVLALVLLSGVELLSALVHPFPANFDGNIREHVRRYPSWVLAAVIPLWGAVGAVCAWLSAKIGGRLAGFLVSMLLFSALLFNLAMLPYPAWFRIGMTLALPFFCGLGIKAATRPLP